MRLINRIVELSPAETALFGLLCLRVDGLDANAALARIDEYLNSARPASVIDCVNLRIAEKVRNNLAALADTPAREPAALTPYQQRR